MSKQLKIKQDQTTNKNYINRVKFLPWNIIIVLLSSRSYSFSQLILFPVHNESSHSVYSFSKPILWANSNGISMLLSSTLSNTWFPKASTISLKQSQEYSWIQYDIRLSPLWSVWSAIFSLCLLTKYFTTSAYIISYS